MHRLCGRGVGVGRWLLQACLVAALVTQPQFVTPMAKSMKERADFSLPCSREDQEPLVVVSSSVYEFMMSSCRLARG